MVAMSVRDDGVLHVLWLEAEFPQPAADLFGRVIGVERIQKDDACRIDKRPGRVDLGANKIEIVEDLGRFGEPGVAGRCRAGRGIVDRLHVGRGQAETRQRAEEVKLSRCLGRVDVGVHVLLCLRQRRRAAQSGGKRQLWLMNADGSGQTQLTSAANSPRKRMAPCRAMYLPAMGPPGWRS